MALSFYDFSLIRIDLAHDILPFDCGDSDLDEFLLTDCKNYYNELLAVTYVIQGNGKTIAFFSVSNDKVTIEDVESGSQWRKKFKAALSHRKHMKSYPAVKIGRLGVHSEHQKHGLGREILDFIKLMFIDKNRTGCRFITVDAYDQSLSYYEKNGFQFMTTKDAGKETRLMYYDLSVLKRSLEEHYEEETEVPPAN